MRCREKTGAFDMLFSFRQGFSLLLFYYFSCNVFDLGFCEQKDTTSDVLLCRKCGHTVAEERQVLEIKSQLALGYKNASVFGQKGMLVQTFKNPEGFIFDLITVSKSNIHQFGEAHPEFSWFPGFDWKMAICPRCKTHLGWTFESTHKDEDPREKYKAPKDYSFVGLILSRLIRKSFADSLIITPKVYQS